MSTPGGIVTEIVFGFFTCPVPEHFKHGLRIDSPTPPQVEHVLSTVKNPDDYLTFPYPLHVGQVDGFAPPAPPLPLQESQLIELGILIVVFFPKKAS